MFKAVNDIDPEYLKKQFIMKDHVYETRTVMPLVVPTFKFIKFSKRYLRYEGVFLWNILGSTLKLTSR